MLWGGRPCPIRNSNSWITEISNCEQESAISSGGMVRMYQTILQKLAQKRSKRNEDCKWSSRLSPSSNAGSFFKSFWETQDSQWTFEPMGLPRMSMLHPVTRIMLDSIEKQSRWPPGRINSHFWELTKSPNSEPVSLIISQAFNTSGTEPNKLPSSIYQEFKDSDGISWFILFTKIWRTRQNRKGPRGSPCWTPAWEEIVWFPKNRRLCWE